MSEIERLTKVIETAKAQLETIVCTVEPDAGVVLLSHEGPTHYDAEHKCQVYDHDYFSPLGDALIALHKLLSNATAPAPASVPTTPRAVLDELHRLQQEGGSFAFDEAVWESLPGLIADSERLAAATAELSRLRAEVNRLSDIAGLMAHPLIAAAIKKHIADEMKTVTPDASFSQTYKVYETGCALMGPSVVVEWHNKAVWFALEGDRVQVDVYPLEPAQRTDLRQRLERAEGALKKIAHQNPNVSRETAYGLLQDFVLAARATLADKGAQPPCQPQS